MLATETIYGNEVDDWQVIQHCVAEIQEPIAYDGTILASGWAGVHGISRAHDTPVIQVFAEDRWVLDGSPIYSLQPPQSNFFDLSPDGEWLAIMVADIEMECPPCWQGQMKTSHILIYNIHQEVAPLAIPYAATYAYGSQSTVRRSFSIHWIDNDTLLLPEIGDFTFDLMPPQAVLLNPFENVFERVNQPIPSLYATDAASVSPGFQHTIMPAENSLSYSDPWQLFDVAQRKTITLIDAVDNLDVAWNSTGDRVIVVIQDNARRLILIDTETRQSEIILSQLDTVYSGPYQTYMSWSYDDRYFAYLQDIDESGDGAVGILHIADVEQRVIYNTCLIAASFTWSPDQYQIAFAGLPPYSATPQQHDLKVQIMDMETWQFFTAASHLGYLLDWIR